MAMDSKPLEEMRANAEQAIKQTVMQTRGAVDSYFEFVKQAIASYPSDGTEFGQKLKEYAEQNVLAAQEFVHKLSEAKDLQDVVRTQTEFMKTQLSAFGERTKSLGDAFTKTATGSLGTPFKKS